VRNVLSLLDLHAGAIQSLCAIATLITAVIALVLLLRTLRATRSQVSVTTNQFSLSAQQYADSIRPIILVRVLEVGNDWYKLELKNDGTGPALGITGTFTHTTNLLGPKSICTVATEKDEKQVVIRYSSLNRRFFETVVNILSDTNCIHQYRELPPNFERV
jgi:hypothetical protein